MQQPGPAHWGKLKGTKFCRSFQKSVFVLLNYWTGAPERFYPFTSGFCVLLMLQMSVCCGYVIKNSMWVFWDAQSSFFFFFSYFCPNAWPSFRQRRSEPEWTKQSVHVAEPSKHSMTHYPASICDITVVTSVTSFKVLYSTIAFSIWTAAEMRFVSKNRGWIL